MKTLYSFVLVAILLTSCAPSTEEIPATASATQTQTATPTLTPSPTPTQTQTPTDTPLPTLTPPSNIITKMEFKNTEALNNPMNAALYTLPKENFRAVLEDIQGTDKVSECPEIWIEPIPEKSYPYYAVIVNMLPEDRELISLFAIRPTISELQPYSVASVATIPPNTTDGFFVAVEYRTPNGIPNPEELEISIVFPGCDIYREDVRWP